MPTLTQTQGGQSSAAINGQSLEYISQQVLLQCPGAPDALVQSVLNNVIRDFYFKSTGWREVIGPYTIVPGVNRIALNPVDQYSQCQDVLGAFVWPNYDAGQTLRYLRPLQRQPFGPGLTTNTGPPYSYYMDGPDTMLLYPNSDQLYGNLLYVYMSLVPALNVGRLPNISMTHHFDGLFYGTLKRLCEMPNKPWTVKDRTVINDWSRMNRQQIVIARDQANRGFGPSEDVQRFPNFAGRYSQSPQHAGGPGF